MNFLTILLLGANIYSGDTSKALIQSLIARLGSSIVRTSHANMGFTRALLSLLDQTLDEISLKEVLQGITRSDGSQPALTQNQLIRLRSRVRGSA